MPQLQLSRVSGSKQRVTVTAEDGSLIEAYEANLLSPRAQKRLSESTGIPQPQIAAAAVRVLPVKAEPISIDFATPGAVASGPFAVTIRGIKESLDAGTTVEASSPAAALLQAFAVADYTQPEPVVQWSDREQLCCLDIDYHALPVPQRPAPAWLEIKAASLQPRPFAFHTSHGRGCKLFYVAQPGFTAAELAAVAAVGWLTQDVRATADLVRVTRHPAYPRPGYEPCGPVHTQTPGSDMAPMARWLQRAVDPYAVEDWLSARGWNRGDKLKHEECLIDPTPSHGDPVYVGEDGIYCHKCAAAGRSLGRSPGFTSYAGVVGGFPPRAAVMLANATHWTHAKLILRAETRLPEPLLRSAYAAALKMQHGVDSPAPAAAMLAGSDVIRMPGRWVSPDGTVTYTTNVHGLINALPAVWSPGTREVLADRRDLFLQATDLAHHGYPAVTPVHGVGVYGQYLAYPDDRVSFAVPAAWCRDAKVAPKYLPAGRRMSREEANAVAESVFPGINWRYVDLLIALKGLAEGGVSQAPFAIVTGPSASAKSSTAHVAASICGDFCSEAKFVSDSVRLMQAIAEGLDKGSFVVLNEIFKEAERAKMKPRAAVDPILTLTPSCLAHRLYIGPRPLGRLPALVLTDINIPDTVHSDLQLARRLIWVQQPGRVNWDAPVTKAGFGDIYRFRLWTPEAAAACDAILSDVVDRFFRHPMSVRDVAKELGLGTLEDCGGVVDIRDQLRRFFKLVVDAPDLAGYDAQRFPGGGWKAIDRGDAGELRDVWDELADSLQGEEWHHSRVAEAEDWSLLLGCTSAVKFERGAYRGKTYVRFRVGSGRESSWVSKQGAEPPV